MLNHSNTNHPAGTQRWVYVVLIAFLLVSHACTLPQLPQPFQPTETAQPTAAPSVIPSTAPTKSPVPPTALPSVQATALPLPPALVETSPISLSEVGPKTSFTFSFNQPMERASVQAALQAQPPVAGSFQWVDDTTVKFTPDQSLPLNADLLLSFNTKARAASGLPLSAPVDVAFHTAAGFALVDQLPRPAAVDADPTSAVVATFTRPIVPLGADPKSLPAGFSLEPAAKGRAEWLNTSTYIFYPDPPLVGGSEYRVLPNLSLTSADGAPWAVAANPLDWTFKTARPSLLTVVPRDPKVDIYLDAKWVLTFNQAMDAASVQQNLTINSPAGAAVPGKLSWNEAGTQVTFTPDALLQRSAQYTLVLSGKAQARGGATLNNDFSQTYRAVPNFGVASSTPADRGTLQMYDVTGGVQVRFTTPLDKQDLNGKFTFLPAVGDPYISANGENAVYISGIFSQRSDYTLTIQPGLRDKWGQVLKEPVVIHFQTPAPPASLGLAVALAENIAFITPRESALSGRATNIKTLNVGYAALTATEFARIASRGSFERASAYAGILAGPPLTKFDRALSLPVDKSSLVELPLNAAGKTQPTGLYFYQYQSPDIKDNKSQPNTLTALLVVSRVQLVIKRSPTQLTVWAVNLETNQPLEGAALVAYTSGKNGELSQAGTLKTNAQGLAMLDYAAPPESYYPMYVVLGKPGDANFSLAMTSWSQGISTYEFGLPTDSQPQTQHAYLYTDRPIYRPGQQVDFRTLVHRTDNGRYSPADLKQVTLKVMGEFSRASGERLTIYQTPLTLSDYGSATGSFALSESLAPGYYTLELLEVPDSAISFQVANYRKPEVDLQVKFSAADLNAGKDIQAGVNARYYFGAPAAGLTLHWVLTAQSAWFALPEGFQAGPLDNGWLLPRWYNFGGGSPIVAEGSVRTAADGQAAIAVGVQEYLDKVDGSRIQELTLEVTLTDEQELPVSARAAATLHPAALYIGVRADAWSGQAKREAGFTVQTFDWKKAPVASRKLTALFQKVVYRQKTDWNFQSQTPPYTLETTKIASTDFQVDTQGRARVAFTPPEPGTYQVELRGDGAVTQLLFWVGGEGRAPWPVLPDNQIRLVRDAAEYQPGQTAKILIPNPLGDKTLALITVERARVMKTEVVPILGSSLEWSLPVTEAYAPNVYVSVLLVGSGATGAPEFRQGYTELTVSSRALQLEVVLSAQPEAAAPGGEVKLGIHVKDNTGKPVQAQFSLSVVDKAVLALAEPNAPTILESFYGRQPVSVTTSLALAVYGRARGLQPQAIAGGRGGGGGDIPPGVVRSDFQDTAYWSGTVVTDANGLALVSLKLPDNLTTWVVTARGLNREMRVGEVTREVVVSKDLLIRAATPRFLVAGDRVQLAATVNNNTAKPISADVALQAGGVELETTAQATQKVELPAQGRARVTWWVRVLNVDQVDLVFSARGGGLEDATRPTAGSLPVLRYSVPQTFGTAGMLVEAGERLEVVSLPRSLKPAGGELSVEMSSSLAGTLLSGLKALDAFPYDAPEPVLSRLLPNLAVYQALTKLGIKAPELSASLQPLIRDAVTRLVSWQNKDGGWGWLPQGESDAYLSAYAVFVLSESQKAGAQVNANVLKLAGDYVAGTLITITPTTRPELVDRQVFAHYALQQAGRAVKTTVALYDVRERLSPWARALLALTLNAQNPTDARARSLLSDLQAQALRSATGAHWETSAGTRLNLSTPVFTTAVVALALARLDPAATVLTDAVRYVVAHRGLSGRWASGYESAWVLMALTEALQASGELSASFAYSASLNGSPLAAGKAGGLEVLAPVLSRVALQSLKAESPNALRFVHEAGAGRLYYRAFLQVYRPVEEAIPLNRGLSIERKITLAGLDCSKVACPALNQVKLSDQNELQVRLTLTLPQAMYNLVVEDFIPAGAEIVDASLKTSQSNVVPLGLPGPLKPDEVRYAAVDPFGGGWNWWLFGAPRVYDDHIRWNAGYLAAGTYQLTYRITPLQAGEFRLLPAHAYETYFPEVEGTSAGAIFRIDP